MSVETFTLAATKFAPSSQLPVIVYRGAFASKDPAEIEDTFYKHGWLPQWRYGMYKKPHFHSNTHEALGVYQGSARILLGRAEEEDEGGREISVEAGDVLVLPAGTMHCSAAEYDGFTMVGAYPRGAPQWDMCLSAVDQDAGNTGATQRQIGEVPVPARDPVTGGKLMSGHWNLACPAL
ncbi:hypothetical protein PYCC9005_001180 [Savitreella phatthalungensis]